MSEKLDFGRVAPVFFLTFVDLLGLTIILPLLHLYAAAYGATPLEIGLVAAAFPLAQLIGVPMMGALSDRFGRKPLLLISQITTFISFIMLGFANSLLMIILSRVVDGLFGANIATAQAALTDLTTEKTRAQGLGLIGAAFGLGFILGPLISLITLSLTDNLAIPAFIAAVYSFISILLTLFSFKETLPPEKRGDGGTGITPFVIVRMLRRPVVNLLLVLMFAQQVIFFGFESLLGLFTLSRLGLLGQGNSILFLVVGIILVVVQVRFIGPWSQKYGEARLIIGSLALLSIGLILVALTPEQPHPFYVERIVANELRDQAPDSTEAIVGEINVALPDESQRGFGGVAWLLVVVIPVSIGAGLIRPSINSLMTQHVAPREIGSVLGVSAAFVSAANATSPLIGGLLFQTYGSTLPFLLGGLLMGVLAVISAVVVKPVSGNVTDTRLKSDKA
ncbi:MAG: tetracycline resistance MFS efflux pump [Anaerolineae bacterium]